MPASLAGYVPLWAAAASDAQATAMAGHLHRFEAAHGITATEPVDGAPDAHDHPTGWAYSTWYVCDGLMRYGFMDDAARIAMKWLRLVAGEHARSGRFLERYNVVDPTGPTPGRYRPQPGFGWTNSVILLLVTRVLVDPDGRPRGAGRPTIAAAPHPANEGLT